MKTQGKIQDLFIRGGQKGSRLWKQTTYLLNDMKLKTFKFHDFNKGDQVNIEYEIDEEYQTKDITSIEKLELSEVKTEMTLKSNKQSNQMSKMNALNNAVAIISLTGLPINTTREEALNLVFGIANKITDFIQ